MLTALPRAGHPTPARRSRRAPWPAKGTGWHQWPAHHPPSPLPASTYCHTTQRAAGQRVLADPPASWRITQPAQLHQRCSSSRAVAQHRAHSSSQHTPALHLHTGLYLDSLGLQTPASMTNPPPRCSVPQRAATPGGMRWRHRDEAAPFLSATAQVSSTTPCWDLLRCSRQSLCSTAAPSAAGTPI